MTAYQAPRATEEGSVTDKEWMAMTDLQWLEHRVARCAAEGWTANKERYERVLKALTDAESTSTALREMREALEEAERALLIASQILTDDHKIALNGRRWGNVALVNLRAAIERTAPSSDSCGLREVCQSMLDDHMTSETHHPRYVLVPKDAFEKARAALTPKDPA